MTSVARADDALQVPRSSPLVAEPVAAPWHAGREASTWRAELFGELAPFGLARSGGDNRYCAFARGGPGVMRLRRSSYLFANAYYELSVIEKATFGAQVTYFRTGGMGVGIGVMTDLDGRPGAMARLHFLLGGFEVQLRELEGRGATAVFSLVLTLPVRGLAGGYRL